MPRKTPYTDQGIRRLSCFRCGDQASQQWQICSDDNTWRPICIKCDVALNRMVLKWMGFKDWKFKIASYIERMK